MEMLLYLTFLLIEFLFIWGVTDLEKRKERRKGREREREMEERRILDEELRKEYINTVLPSRFKSIKKYLYEE